MNVIRMISLIVVTGLLCACDPRVPPNPSGNFIEPESIRIYRDNPETTQSETTQTETNACWGKDQTPAHVQTITERVLITPAQYDDMGHMIQPAVFETRTRQEIVEVRETIWFKAVCPETLTPEFIASLQRAMALRNIYNGEISGVMDIATHNAIRNLQKAQGLNSPVLSIIAARKLGLVTYNPDDIARF